MAGIEQLHKSILENLGAVHAPLFCQGSHPRRQGDIFADCPGVGCSPVCKRINTNNGTGGISGNIQLVLRSGNRDIVSFILCHYEPAAGRIGNHLNGIINAAAGGNASRQIRYSAVIFCTIFIWYEYCGIDIFHKSASFAVSGEALPPALLDFFAYIAEIVFIKVPAFQRYGIFCFWIIVNIMVPAASLEGISAAVQILDSCVSWIHYFPPYKRIIHKNTQYVKRFTQLSEIPLNPY